MTKQFADPPDTPLKRRGFIAKAIQALSSLMGGTIAASAGIYLFGTPPGLEEGWADAGHISALQPGSPQALIFERSRTDAWKIRNEKASAWVILDNRNSITAFSPQCTHLGCAYRWEAAKREFVCPCHGSVFAEDGQVVSGPATRPLDRIRTRVVGSRLWLGPVEDPRRS